MTLLRASLDALSVLVWMMALQVGELFSKLEINTQGADQSLQQHHHALQQTEQQAARTEQSVASVGQVIAGAGQQARAAQANYEGVTVRIGQWSASIDDLTDDVKALNPELLKEARGLADVGKSAQDAGKQTDAAARGTGALSNVLRLVGQNAGQMERGVGSGSRALREMTSASQQTEGALSRVGGMMQQVIATAAGFVVAQVVMKAFRAAVDFVKESFIGMNDLLEQTNVAFTTMLGSAELAGSFIKDLAEFAARTPFDFPGLLRASQRMLAYGFAAQEVLPLLEDIGNVSAGLGAGAQGIDRITIALGQMTTKGRVQTQELLQLTEAGVPAFQMLADAIGVSTGEVQDLVTAGEISSDVFLRIFHEWAQANFGEMMAKQSKTFTGAMSNITDIMQMSVARGLEPFFNALRDGAVRIAEFLETARFERWVSTLHQISQAAVDAILSIPGTARAFQEWVSTILSEGVTLNAFLGSLPDWFQTALGRIQDMMGIGGHNAIVAYAQGIVDGASTYVTQAINYVADLIASYLVGQSPPKDGPLSQIDKAGQNLMETYTEGMAEGAKGAEKAAAVLKREMDELGDEMELDAGRAGLEAATGNLEEMERVAGDVERKLTDIDAELRAIDSQLLEIDRDVAEINEKYDEQLEPLQEQLRLLERQRDLQAEKLQLEHDLHRAQVNAALLAAMGDPERRAEIAGEMALVDLQQDRLDNEQKIADIKAQLEGGGKELTAEERERLELRERDLELQRRETQAKLRDGKDLSKLEKERLQLKLDQIDADLRENRARQNAEPEELTDAQRRRLELQLQELELRGELLGMIDAEQMAQAEADGELLDARQKERDLIEEIADIQNDIAKIPILEEIERVEAARRKELEPLQAQRDLLQDQRADLDYLRQQWQFLKADVNDALQPLREAARLQEQMAKDAEKQRKELEGAAKAASKATRPDNSFEAASARLAGTGEACPAGWVMDEFGRCSNPAEEAWKQSIKDAEAAGKATPGLDLPGWSELFPDELEVPVTLVPGADGDNLTLDMLQPQPESFGAKMGAMFADGFIGRVGELIKSNMGRIMGASIGAAIGGITLGVLSGGVLTPLGTAIGGLLGGFIGTGLQDALAERGIDLSGVIGPLQEGLQGAIGSVMDAITPTLGRLAEWFDGDGRSAAESFGTTVQTVWNDWIRPAIDRVVRDTLPALQDAWARIEPTIRPALETVVGIFQWVRDQIDIHSGTIRRVIEGAWTFISEFINTRIRAISSFIAGVLSIIGGDWEGAWQHFREFLKAEWDTMRLLVDGAVKAIQKFIKDGLPVIWENLQEWGAAFVDWIAPRTGPMLEESGNLLTRFGEWMIDTALPVIWEKIQEWGAVFVDWVAEYTPPLLAALGRLLVEFGDWLINVALPVIVSNLAKWGLAFVDWVAPQIPPLLSALRQLLADLIVWMVTEALPAIITNAAKWGWEFHAWVADAALVLLDELVKLSYAMTQWMANDALPAISAKLNEWSAAFVNWVYDEVVPRLIKALPEILKIINEWSTGAIWDVGIAGSKIGVALVEGIWEGITGLGGWFKGKVDGFIKEHVPDFIYDKVIEGGSPARVMIPIGESIVQGMMAGIENEQQKLSRQLIDLGSMITQSAEMSIAVPRVSSRIPITLPTASGSEFDTLVARLGQGSGRNQPIIINQTITLDGEVIDRRTIRTINRHGQTTW